jgi:hypothetical protein
VDADCLLSLLASGAPDIVIPGAEHHVMIDSRSPSSLHRCTEGAAHGVAWGDSLTRSFLGASLERNSGAGSNGSAFPYARATDIVVCTVMDLTARPAVGATKFTFPAASDVDVKHFLIGETNGRGTG